MLPDQARTLEDSLESLIALSGEVAPIPSRPVLTHPIQKAIYVGGRGSLRFATLTSALLSDMQSPLFPSFDLEVCIVLYNYSSNKEGELVVGRLHQYALWNTHLPR